MSIVGMDGAMSEDGEDFDLSDQVAEVSQRIQANLTQALGEEIDVGETFALASLSDELLSSPTAEAQDGDFDESLATVDDVVASLRRRLGLDTHHADGSAAEDGMDYIGSENRPQRVPNAPPVWAKAFYKVVAKVNNRSLSIYDGVTEYETGTTLAQKAEEDHQGGIYVYESVQNCLKSDLENFPRSSALLHAPRAIAKVLAWNATRHEMPSRYGHKLAFTYVRVTELLPYPKTWAVGRELSGNKNEQQRGKRYTSSSTALSRGTSLLQAQAATLALEEDVRRMESRLEIARGAS